MSCLKAGYTLEKLSTPQDDKLLFTHSTKTAKCKIILTDWEKKGEGDALFDHTQKQEPQIN